jgi:hypothetical protein
VKKEAAVNEGCVAGRFARIRRSLSTAMESIESIYNLRTHLTMPLIIHQSSVSPCHSLILIVSIDLATKDMSRSVSRAVKPRRDAHLDQLEIAPGVESTNERSHISKGLVSVAYN